MSAMFHLEWRRKSRDAEDPLDTLTVACLLPACRYRAHIWRRDCYGVVDPKDPKNVQTAVHVRSDRELLDAAKSDGRWHLHLAHHMHGAQLYAESDALFMDGAA